MENANRKMGSKPDGTKQQDDAKHQFSRNGGGARQWRLDGGDFEGRVNQDKHGDESHGDDENGGQDGGENSFHGERLAATTEK
jgi:hypothetical protein